MPPNIAYRGRVSEASGAQRRARQGTGVAGGEEIVVAWFNHDVDGEGAGRLGRANVSAVRLIDFGANVVPPNENLSMEQRAHQHNRVTTRTSTIARELAREAEQTAQLDR